MKGLLSQYVKDIYAICYFTNNKSLFDYVYELSPTHFIVLLTIKTVKGFRDDICLLIDHDSFTRRFHL